MARGGSLCRQRPIPRRSLGMWGTGPTHLGIAAWVLARDSRKIYPPAFRRGSSLLLLSPFSEVRILLNNLLPLRPTVESGEALKRWRGTQGGPRVPRDDAHPNTSELSFFGAAELYGAASIRSLVSSM